MRECHMNKYDKNAFNILLVEDDEIDIQSISRTIKKIDMPIQLNVARNGVDALNQLTAIVDKKELKHMPNLIIMDINMPKMSGIEFLEKIRSNPKLNVAKIIILTTSDDMKDKLIFSKLHVDAYITKPINAGDLMKFCKDVGVQ